MPALFPILVINCGSSSLKFSVLDPESEAVLASGIAEQLGTDLVIPTNKELTIARETALITV